MKIVLAVHQFLPEFSAGTEILTYETAKELSRRGHEVEVVTALPVDPSTAKEQPFSAYEYNGLSVRRYNHNVHVISPNKYVMEFEYNNFSFAKYFRGYLKESKPDIVHFFHLSRLTASCIDVGMECKIPMVFTPTDFWIICPTCQLRLPDNGLCLGPDLDGVNCIRHVASVTKPRWVERVFNAMPYRLLAAFSRATGKSWWPEKRQTPTLHILAERKDFIIKRINRLDRVLVPTRFMEKIFIQNGVNNSNFHFLPFGINLGPFKKMAKKRRDRLQIGFIGTLIEHKGAHVLLEAVKLLHKDIPFDVKIYGKLEENPGYMAKLRSIAEGDKRIEFCGHFPNDKIGEVFSGLDALVVPSIWYENTPLVIYSAHAAGVPVIGTNLGGIAEIVHHEKNGLLFEKDDSAGLRMALKRLIKDRTLLDRLAKNLVPPHSISAYVDGLEEVYRDVLAKRRKNT